MGSETAYQARVPLIRRNSSVLHSLDKWKIVDPDISGWRLVLNLRVNESRAESHTMDLLGCFGRLYQKELTTDNEYLASIDRGGLNTSVTCDLKCIPRSES